MLRIFLAMISAFCFATMGMAKPSLWSLPAIEAGLIQIGLAHGIQENCDRIRPNKLGGYTYANSLRSIASRQGYSFQEIKNFIASEREKRVLRKKVEEMLKARGINPYAPNALCPIGEQHISDQTTVGMMLVQHN